MWRLSWFLIYLVFVLLLTSVTTVMLYVLGVCHQSNGGLVFLLLLLYDLSVLALSFMITPFFDNAKVKCVSSMLIIAFPVSNSIQSYRTCKFVDKLLSFLFFFSFFIFHFSFFFKSLQGYSVVCRRRFWTCSTTFKLLLAIRPGRTSTGCWASSLRQDSLWEWTKFVSLNWWENEVDLIDDLNADFALGDEFRGSQLRDSVGRSWITYRRIVHHAQHRHCPLHASGLLSRQCSTE